MTAEVNDRPLGRIVVGVDGSEASRDALAWAAGQARLSGASLEVVTGWQVSPAPYSYPLAVPSYFDPETEAKQVLEETVHDVLGEGPGVSRIVVEGPASKVLVQRAEGADLLVVGNRGHRALMGALVGSVSEHCITHASCPVVVVRHLPAAR